MVCCMISTVIGFLLDSSLEPAGRVWRKLGESLEENDSLRSPEYDWKFSSYLRYLTVLPDAYFIHAPVKGPLKPLRQ